MRKVYIFILGILFYSRANAQLSFPKGKVLNLVTSEQILYFETEIPFTIKGGKIADYSYQYVSDSIDFNWEVSSCMNGECLIGFPKSGTFTNINKAPDTVGYLRFHVDSRDIPGKSTVRYKVYHTSNISDIGELEFNITYVKPSGVSSSKSQSEFKVYPIPAKDKIYIEGLSASNQSILLYNMLGQCVYQSASTGTGSYELAVCDFPQGVYVLKVGSVLQKIVIE